MDSHTPRGIFAGDRGGFRLALGAACVVAGLAGALRARRRRTEAEHDDLLRLERLARLDASQARDQLEAILRGVADAVTAQAPDGRLLFANDAAVATLGYESSEALLAAPPKEDPDLAPKAG